MDHQINVFRLCRAVHLTVEPLGQAHRYHVSGGTQRHLVDWELGECDCADHCYRRTLCAHLLAAALREGEPSVLAALRLVVPNPDRVGRRLRSLAA
jgi:hypothetical protein